MSKPTPEVRIILRKRTDGTTELSVYDPVKMYERRTGMTARPDTLDKEVRGLKETFERAGNYVTVKEMGPP